MRGVDDVVGIAGVYSEGVKSKSKPASRGVAAVVMVSGEINTSSSYQSREIRLDMSKASTQIIVRLQVSFYAPQARVEAVSRVWALGNG